MALQQVQDTSEDEVTMVFPTFSYIFTRDGRISRRMAALSNCPRAETGPRKPDELVVGLVMKTIENPREETGNQCPENLIVTPHTS